MKKIFPLFLLFFFLPLAGVQTIEKNILPLNDSNCPGGGMEVLVGEDTGGDGLDENEITSRVCICNGENGCDMLSGAQQSSSLGAKCPTAYGVVVTSGVDCDSNGNIDAGKAIETVICYGVKGENGSGSSVSGGNAADGETGADGKVSEIVVSEEPKGENCKEGGTKIETRFDSDGNGSFGDDENSVSYICNGESPQGSQGEQGKQGIAGTDGKDGADGAQGERGDKGEQGDQGEVGEPGEAGPDGFDSLVSVVDEPAGDNCENGGKKFMSGIDKDGNGLLDEREVKNSSYICNGKNAVEASEAAASSGCSLTLF